MKLTTKREVFVTLTLTEKEANYIKHLCITPKKNENEYATTLRVGLYDVLNCNNDISDYTSWNYENAPVAMAAPPIETKKKSRIEREPCGDGEV